MTGIRTTAGSAPNTFSIRTGVIKKTATEDESYFRFSLKTGKFMRKITPEAVRKG